MQDFCNDCQLITNFVKDFYDMRHITIKDIAKELGCNKIVLWLAREGTLCYESKSPVEATNRLIEWIHRLLPSRCLTSFLAA